MRDAKFNDLGIEISVSLMPTKYLGEADPKTGEIRIHPNQHKLGQIVTLIHEMLHLCEGSMRAEGKLRRNIDHGFIHGAAFGAAIALARCGALGDIGPDDIAEFMKMAAKGANEDGCF